MIVCKLRQTRFDGRFDLKANSRALRELNRQTFLGGSGEITPDADGDKHHQTHHRGRNATAETQAMTPSVVETRSFATCYQRGCLASRRDGARLPVEHDAVRATWVDRSQSSSLPKTAPRASAPRASAASPASSSRSRSRSLLRQLRLVASGQAISSGQPCIERAGFPATKGVRRVYADSAEQHRVSCALQASMRPRARHAAQPMLPARRGSSDESLEPPKKPVRRCRPVSPGASRDRAPGVSSPPSRCAWVSGDGLLAVREQVEGSKRYGRDRLRSVRRP